MLSDWMSVKMRREVGSQGKCALVKVQYGLERDNERDIQGETERQEKKAMVSV